MTNKRNPHTTRLKIMTAAFEEIHKHGFQGMRVDRLLDKTGLKKGALYHHFASKQELGYAVFEELIQQRITELWINPLKDFKDPLEGIYTICQQLEKSWDAEFFKQGCPLNNLAQEMSPIDEGFRTRIDNFFQHWKTSIAEALKKGQQQGIIDLAVNVDDSALFILAAIEGSLGLTKNHQCQTVYSSCSRELKRYLDSLRVSKHT